MVLSFVCRAARFMCILLQNYFFFVLGNSFVAFATSGLFIFLVGSIFPVHWFTHFRVYFKVRTDGLCASACARETWTIRKQAVETYFVVSFLFFIFSCVHLLYANYPWKKYCSWTLKSSRTPWIPQSSTYHIWYASFLKCWFWHPERKR